MSRAKQEQKKLLVVEDDPGLQSQMKWCFEGYDVVIAADRGTAISALRRHEPAVVLLDLGLPPDPENASEGLAALEEILALAPATKVIVVTGNDERANAVQAIAKGAYDFYQKPVEPEVLGLLVERAYYLFELEQENRKLLQQSGASPIEGIIATSPQMMKVCRTIEKVAPTGATTLLLGESGTGKEVIARALHNLSDRAKKPFVAINCGAIPETLLESELFGYEKGAFTGAGKQTKGKIEYADGGTLFLDEIGDIPQSLQVKLLRFLQERVIERLGGRGEIPVDVRVVCATNQNLMQLVESGAFREDLYYRISEIIINIPPLRERDGDALLLARVFLERFARDHGRNLRGFTEDGTLAVENYRWPGNVREMENKLKRAVIMAEGNCINAEALELDEVADEGSMPLNLRAVRERAERGAIARAINMFDNNISQAAEALGVSRPTLYDLMNKYGLK
ncbi:PEP-CTERM-box response regulator transcription factor [Candidatus Tenderia electrophaga]|uniref:PEP-CTERM-box response regulator transcription factor n=1 Tax=Candidatus Tenderia electrophaga TaxID=1748243 RepID=A0A0S2TG76_9GAMM|nr:PEP-CTERM-box response regulator transcription factor [Candidatus Tenderia electrophaga]